MSLTPSASALDRRNYHAARETCFRAVSTGFSTIVLVPVRYDEPGFIWRYQVSVISLMDDSRFISKTSPCHSKLTRPTVHLASNHGFSRIPLCPLLLYLFP